MRNSYTIIENEAAYANAIQRRIKENARKGRGARWLAEDPTRADLIATLRNKAYDKPGSFFDKMFQAYDEWGSLTEGQEKAIRKILTEDAAKRAERLAVAAANSNHIGTVGERLDFTLKVKATTNFEGTFGMVFVTIMETETGDVIVYKGSNPLVVKGKVVPSERGHIYENDTIAARGDVVTFKATVKAHTARDMVKQTLVSRPKVASIAPGL